MSAVVNKYLAAFLQLAIVVLTAFVAIPEFNTVAVLQLAILALGAIVTFFVPLLQSDNPYVAGLVKTGVAVVVAALTAIIPLVTEGVLTPAQIGIVILAALNALATQIGVSVRKDQQKIASSIPQETPTDVIDPH